jgi:hypothetical protein
MAEAFVKTFRRDYAAIDQRPTRQACCGNCALASLISICIASQRSRTLFA